MNYKILKNVRAITNRTGHDDTTCGPIVLVNLSLSKNTENRKLYVALHRRKRKKEFIRGSTPIGMTELDSLKARRVEQVGFV